MDKVGVKNIGGKSRYLTWIYSLFPRSFKFFIDVFAGGGWVLLNWDGWDVVKVLNDKDELVVNFFMVLRDNKDELIRRLYYLPYSRSLSNRYKKLVRENKLSEDKIERAVAWLYSVETSFSGNLYSGFGVAISRRRSVSMDFKEFIDVDLEKIANRLKGVIIENLDFKDVIKKYDNEASFFYLDPPYKSAHKFRVNFTDKDREDLILLLKSIKGKFLLNCYERDFDFNSFDKSWVIIKKTFVNYGSMAKGEAKRPKKVLYAIMNYKGESLV